MKWGKKQLTTVSYILTTVKVVTKDTKALQIILEFAFKSFHKLLTLHILIVLLKLSVESRTF